MNKKFRIISGILLVLVLGAGFAQGQGQGQGQEAAVLTVKEIMNALITPGTATIWGAYQLESEAEWQAVANAALTVLAAGELLSRGGAGEGARDRASAADWQQFNRQMMAAAQEVLATVAARDEEALSAVGNDLLYPPCESCHQQYQSR